jgi:hypothetical protein
VEARRARARDLFPAVLLTVLGIIQAVALEFLWERALSSTSEWRAAEAAATGWLQIAAVFQGLVIVWVAYSTIVMRLSWVPWVRDLVTPFVVGLLELILIELMNPTQLHWWFFQLALIFSFVTWAAQTMFLTAARDPENVDETSDRRREVMAGNLPSAVFVLVLVLLGLLVLWRGPDGPAALVALLLANGVMLVQLGVLRWFWHRDVFGSPRDPAAV